MDRADYCFCVRAVSHSLSLSYPLVLYNNVKRSLLVISSSYYTLITSNWIYYIDSGNIGNIRLDRENQIDRLTVRSIIFEMEDTLTLEDLTYPVVDSTKQRSQSKLCPRHIRRGSSSGMTHRGGEGVCVPTLARVANAHTLVEGY